MTADFQQKKVYRLIRFTAAARVKAHVASFDKAEFMRVARIGREKAEAEARKAAKAKANGSAPAATEAMAPAPAPRPRPAKLLCQSKQRTALEIYYLALGVAGAFATGSANPRTISRDEALKQAGLRRKPKRPKHHYENVVPQLRVSTSQAGMAKTCGTTVRSLQRHLDDMEALGLVLVRQQLGLNGHNSVSFQLVLDASFLDWQEILLNAYGVAVNEGPDSGPLLAPGAAPSPDVPPPPIAAPVDYVKALTALEQMEAMRKKMSAPFAKS